MVERRVTMKLSIPQSRLVSAQELADLAEAGLRDRARTGEEMKDAGQEQAITHSSDTYRKHFTRWIEDQPRGTEYTSENITATIGMPPGHPSVVGALMTAAAKRDLHVKVGYAKAKRVNQHAAMLTLWSRK